MFLIFILAPFTFCPPDQKVLKTHGVASVLNSHWGQEQQQRHPVEMKHALPNYDSSMRGENVDMLMKGTQESHLKRHLKIHSGEKSNKATNLKTHLKIHRGEKSNKCNQCDYASAQASNLKTHLKFTLPETGQLYLIFAMCYH